MYYVNIMKIMAFINVRMIESLLVVFKVGLITSLELKWPKIYYYYCFYVFLFSTFLFKEQSWLGG